jgi:hypothetical protein
MVQLGALRRVGHVGAVDQQGVGRFHEEERRLAIRIAAHFARVLGVVAADAEDAADGEGPTAGDGDCGDGGRGDHEIGHVGSCRE